MIDTEARSAFARAGQPSAEAAVTVAYLAGLAAAELTLVAAGPIPGALAHAALLLGLAIHATMLPDAPYQRMLAAITLAPMIRLLSLLLPISGVPPVFSIALVGGLSLVGVAVAVRVLMVRWADLGFRRFDWGVQSIIAAAGFPSGLAIWVAARPLAVVPELSIEWVVLSIVVFTVFVAGVEGLAFRGLIQTMARERFGTVASIAIATLVPSVLLLSALDPIAILLLTALNLALAWAVDWSRSTVGAIGAHALALFGMLVLWPLTLG
ncbi:MAG: CPBP family intramembrane metalloprotease [Chloroflexi bacterium]|nr:CPBP family intramembrane metalloprotease [Chloroflexota bacterium]